MKKIFERQPPSGGCVLKQYTLDAMNGIATQPPSGGCVLKLISGFQVFKRINQPPSGGCVLKLKYLILKKNI